MGAKNARHLLHDMCSVSEPFKVQTLHCIQKVTNITLDAFQRFNAMLERAFSTRDQGKLLANLMKSGPLSRFTHSRKFVHRQQTTTLFAHNRIPQHICVLSSLLRGFHDPGIDVRTVRFLPRYCTYLFTQNRAPEGTLIQTTYYTFLYNIFGKYLSYFTFIKFYLIF